MKRPVSILWACLLSLLVGGQTVLECLAGGESYAKTKPPTRATHKRYTTSQAKKVTTVKKTTTAKVSISGTPLIHQADAQVQAGVTYHKYRQKLLAGPVQINVIDIDPKTPGIEVFPALAEGRMRAKSNVVHMVNGYQAIAGINGSFFKPDAGIPLGILMINQELISGPIYDRVALGITSDNALVMDRVHLGGELILPSGKKLPIHNVNQPRVSSSQTVVYSSRWGSKAPKIPANGVQIKLVNNHPVQVSTSIPLDIPKDGFIISGQLSPAMQELANLPSYAQVGMNVYTLPDWSSMRHAIGGGPWLVKNGDAFVDATEQHFSSAWLKTREPRTAAGITQDGHMLLVTVDGRQPGHSIGLTLYELAHLMRRLGAVQAMNLDGGSSTQMAINGRSVNRPSSGLIGVSNSLIVRQTGIDRMAYKGE